jgi:hypothetical protein
VKLIQSFFRTLLATVGAGAVIAGFALGAFAASVYLIERAFPSKTEAVVIRPGDTRLAPMFMENPMAVLVCWKSYEKGASYDLLIRHWDFGNEWTEVKEGIDLVPCAGDFGATHIFARDNLYHLELRACVERTCSDWVPVIRDATHWLQVPCNSARGDGCYYADEGGEAKAVR